MRAPEPRLVADPFSEHTFCYDFNIQYILSLEEQPSITNMEGESVFMVRLWVKKKSIGRQICLLSVSDTPTNKGVDFLYPFLG